MPAAFVTAGRRILFLTAWGVSLMIGCDHTANAGSGCFPFEFDWSATTIEDLKTRWGDPVGGISLDEPEKGLKITTLVYPKKIMGKDWSAIYIFRAETYGLTETYSRAMFTVKKLDKNEFMNYFAEVEAAVSCLFGAGGLIRERGVGGLGRFWQNDLSAAIMQQTQPPGGIFLQFMKKDSNMNKGGIAAWMAEDGPPGGSSCCVKRPD